MSKAHHWCFTHNNYTDEDVAHYSQLIKEDRIKYVIFGFEKGESGTPHLQGHVKFSCRVRLHQARAFLKGHVTVCKDISKSIAYCKKEGNWREFGVAPCKPRARNDLESFKDTVKSGVYEMDKLYEMHSGVCARYPRFVESYVSHSRPAPEVPEHEVSSWQLGLKEILDGEPNPREVIFVVDSVGGKGKSWFAQWYCQKFPPCQVKAPGKKVDIRVLFVDAPRSKQDEYIQYDFLEEVKNGYVFSGKYDSKMKLVTKTHIVVMMNENPSMVKLSSDRYRIISLDSADSSPNRRY